MPEITRRTNPFIFHQTAYRQMDHCEESNQAMSTKFVQEYLARERIFILFDGTFLKTDQLRKAETADQIATFLGLEQPTERALVDDMVLFAQEQGMKLSDTDVQRALRKEVRCAQARRRVEVLEPLCCQLTLIEQERAERSWIRLCETVFEGDPTLARAGLQHFIWQVKRKSLGLAVLHHLMPVITSEAQGTGKTNFMLKFMAALEELATGPVLLSDLADPRSADIFRYPVVLLDDMEAIDSVKVPALKSLLTGRRLRRRRLGSSDSIGIEQRTTPIGTANHGIENLVADPTGHRRFLVLPFRNGAVSNGGDPCVWQVVNETDYVLLWRSVDVYGAAPISPHLPALFRYQARLQPVDPLKEWLLRVEIESDEMKRITTPHGVRASGLYKAFVAATNNPMTVTAFGRAMKDHTLDPQVPFHPKDRTGAGFFYRLRSLQEPKG